METTRHPDRYWLAYSAGQASKRTTWYRGFPILNTRSFPGLFTLRCQCRPVGEFFCVIRIEISEIRTPLVPLLARDNCINRQQPRCLDAWFPWKPSIRRVLKMNENGNRVAGKMYQNVAADCLIWRGACTHGKRRDETLKQYCLHSVSKKRHWCCTL